MDALIEDDALWTMEGWLKGQPTAQEEISYGMSNGKP